jgi:hypothetical protein
MTLVAKVPRNPAGKAQYPRAAELAVAPGEARQSI